MRAEALFAALLAASAAAAQAPAPPPVPADAAPAAAAPTEPPREDDLGTLFHSPQERARLDKMRRGEPPEPAAGKRAPAAVTGFVQRSDGRNTVWIDGRPVPVASPRAAPLFDPRVVRDMPRPAEPPAAKADAPPGKADAEGATKDAPAPKAEAKAESKAESKAEVKQ